MKIIDRYIVKNFLLSTLLWFVVMMSMRIVIDLFMNMDEFLEHQGSTGRVVGIIVAYYGYNSLDYIAQMGGLVILLGAITTLFLMNRSNELVALLASGVSLHRVVWPIIVCAMALSTLLIIDQELCIPVVADKLVLNPDDEIGKQKGFTVRLKTDGQHAVWYSKWFDPVTEKMQEPQGLVRNEKHLNLTMWASGSEGHPGKMDGLTGWMLSDGKLRGMARGGKVWRNVQDDRHISTYVGPAELLALAKQPEKSNLPIRNVWVSDEDYGMVICARRFIPDPFSPDRPGRLRGGKLVKPTFTFWTKLVPSKEAGNMYVPAPSARVVGVFKASSATWRPRGVPTTQEASGSTKPSRMDDCWMLKDGKLLVVSDLTTQELILRHSGRAQQLMSFRSLTKMLQLKFVPDRAGVELTRHTRVTDAISNLLMLMLGLPFILSRERNIKASAGLCLLMVGAYYALVYVSRYVGLPPVWAAWLPILLFGPVAVVMLDSVKT